MRNYEEFKEALTKNMKERLGKEAEVTVHTVAKTNHTEEHITICFPETKVAPSVNLRAIFREYEKSGNIDTVAENLMEMFSRIPEGFQMPMLTVEEAKENIFYQLISKEKNEALLKDCLYREVPDTDLVMILRWKCGEDATFIVKHDIAEHLNLPESELFRFADDNLASKHCIFQGINEMLAGMLGFDEDDIPDVDFGLYVLTNADKQYGATMMLRADAIDMVRQKLGCSFYILPSSTHEVLIVPDRDELEPETLRAMVKEVNQTEVADSDVLSNHIYRCGSDGKVGMVM